MRIWSAVSQKGGCGKTTLLLHAAVAAMAEGLNVLVCDLDPQRSAEQWSEWRENRLATDEPTVVHGTAMNLDGMLEAARETRVDIVLIDTPPAVDKSMIYAAAAADVVIVPTRSSLLDQFALKETLDYLKRIGALSKSIVVINAPSKDQNAKIDTQKIATEGFGVPVLPTALDDQVDLASSLAEGKGIAESAPKRKAGKSFQKVYQELCAFEAGLSKKARVA
jgi:chromosome partitioning protein